MSPEAKGSTPLRARAAQPERLHTIQLRRGSRMGTTHLLYATRTREVPGNEVEVKVQRASNGCWLAGYSNHRRTSMDGTGGRAGLLAGWLAGGRREPQCASLNTVSFW